MNNKRQYQRTISIKIDPMNIRKYDGLALDLKNQTMSGYIGQEIMPLIGDSSLEFSRDRLKGGKKILHTSSRMKNTVWLDPNRQFLDYDHLIAVDTNTKKVCGSTVSITAAYHLIIQNHDSGKASCAGSVLALFEAWNVKEKPENIGWWQVLQGIEKRPQNFLGSIGFIVDSDLDNHNKFNLREMPIVGDYFLPTNVHLMYASDQGGSEYLSSKMIKYCHDLASDLFKEENLVMNTGDLRQGVDGLYSHFRQWDTEARDLRQIFELI
ncbi:hypothetical protein [Teredinibacter sp. KSP-S5-2]|uniref:hypothetical protein n=1 Tax=Teredinibacter sp. KSP-S5-2 TaxID=3034506 RepID=UPI002934FACB|nr:hypothetical protein [Teredinibacter sp. KSP-S5-2]WNO10378.1 hypothetical protein P5V12_04265 [Teredinibacter sp. KSP-S5-2]